MVLRADDAPAVVAVRHVRRARGGAVDCLHRDDRCSAAATAASAAVALLLLYREEAMQREQRVRRGVAWARRVGRAALARDLGCLARVCRVCCDAGALAAAVAVRQLQVFSIL